MFEFKLPSLGADMDEGKLLEWLVHPGDKVKKGQVVAVVDTSKAAVDVEIWQEGTVHELLAEPGTKMPVGTVMAMLLEPGEVAPPQPARPTRRARKAVPEGPLPSVAGAAPVVAPAPVGAARKRISPAARKCAEALGVDIAAVLGSGQGDAVTLADVERAAAAGCSACRGSSIGRRPPG